MRCRRPGAAGLGAAGVPCRHPRVGAAGAGPAQHARTAARSTRSSPPVPPPRSAWSAHGSTPTPGPSTRPSHVSGRWRWSGAADDSLRALSVIVDVLGTTVSGLGPAAETLLAGYGPSRVASLARDLGITPSGDRHRDVTAIAERLADPAHVDVLLGEVDDKARAILEHLEREGRDGSVENTDRPRRPRGRGRPRRPAPRPRAAGRPGPPARRRTPRGRGRRCAAAAPPVSRSDVVPPLATGSRRGRPGRPGRRRGRLRAGPARRAAAGALGHAPPVRAARAAASGSATLTPPRSSCTSTSRLAALHIELAAAAGLLGVGATDEHDAAWLPTDAFDVWSAGTVADRWARLALAWLENPRLVGLVGTRLQRQAGQRPRPRPGAVLAGRDPAGRPGRDRARCRRCRCSRPAPASRRWSRGWPGCARGARPRARRPPPGRWRRPPWSASSGSAGSPTHGRALLAGEDPAARRTGRARAAAARAGRPRAAPGRPDRGRARAAGPATWPTTSPRWPTSSPGAARPSTGSPSVRPARVRLRLVGRRGARVPRRVVAHPGAAAAGVPRRRRLPEVRHRPGGLGRVVPAQRRRVGARRAGAPPEVRGLRLRRIAPTVVVSDVPARRAAPPAARARVRPGRRGRRRHGPAGPPRGAPREDARARVRRPASCSGSRPPGREGGRPVLGPRRRDGHRDPRGRPGRGQPTAGHRHRPAAPQHPDRPRWRRCARRSRPSRRCGSATSTTTARPWSGWSTRSRSRAAG